MRPNSIGCGAAEYDVSELSHDLRGVVTSGNPEAGRPATSLERSLVGDACGPSPSRKPKFDLQSHSRHSDGALEPAAVVAAAAAAGIRLLALTDHDTVSGVDEALEAATGAGIRVVPAVELSAVDGEHEELHILGYEIDHRDEGFLTLLEVLRRDRERRVLEMANRLRKLGFAVGTAMLDARLEHGLSLGRPHLAEAVFREPVNAHRLARDGIGRPSELFPAYLVAGAPAYVPRRRPTIREAIALIHDVGGLAVWAHPYWDLDQSVEVESTLRRFADEGLDGVEAFYPTHTVAQTHHLDDMAHALGLLTTGSADFHGPRHDVFAHFGAFDLAGRAPRLGRLAQDIDAFGASLLGVDGLRPPAGR